MCFQFQCSGRLKSYLMFPGGPCWTQAVPGQNVHNTLPWFHRHSLELCELNSVRSSTFEDANKTFSFINCVHFTCSIKWVYLIRRSVLGWVLPRKNALVYLTDDPNITPVFNEKDMSALKSLYTQSECYHKFWCTVDAVSSIAEWGGNVCAWLASCACCKREEGVKQTKCTMIGRNAVGLACGQDVSAATKHHVFCFCLMMLFSHFAGVCTVHLRWKRKHGLRLHSSQISISILERPTFSSRSCRTSTFGLIAALPPLLQMTWSRLLPTFQIAKYKWN